MWKSALSIFITILLSNITSADVVRRGSVPELYWGMWVASKSDQPVIQLSAKRYANSEAACSVNWVSETPGAGGSIYAAYLQCVRCEKTAGRFSSNLIIWPKGSNQIAIGPEFARLEIFRRCPAPNQTPIATCEGKTGLHYQLCASPKSPD
jgi:hypothetical protein